MKARIFISHSCKDRKPDPDDALLYARKVRQCVVDALQEKHTVWLDVESLMPGDRWRVRLHEWLGCCDGAVILLDKTSVSSAWLRKEATILGWRASLQDRVRVIPVFLGDFETADLDRYDYASLDLDIVQAARLASTDLTDANAQALGEIVAASFDDLAPAGHDSAMTLWVKSVASLIDKTIDDPMFIELAAEKLDVEDADWTHFRDRSVAVARQLLHLGLERGLGALNILEQHMDDNHFARLATLCLPTWVNADAGAELNAMFAQVPRPVAAVNSDNVQIGKEYVGRAGCLPVPDRLFVTVSDPVGEGNTQELLPRYEEMMRHQLGIPPGKPEALRADLEFAGVEMFVLLSGAAANPDVMAALQDRYPRAKFLLLPGLECQPGPPHGPRIVRPELDEGQLDALEGWRRQLDRMVGG